MTASPQTQMKITVGARIVVASRNDMNSRWTSRLYVNCAGDVLGEATLLVAKHSTEAGACRWARKVLGE
jgi:hypothetical protein